MSVLEGDRRLLASLIGRELEAVAYEESGDVESAYLRFDSFFVSVGAVSRDGSPVGWPWRLTLEQVSAMEVPGDLVARFKQLGRILGVRIYGDELREVARGVAFELSSVSTLWAWSRGGDFIDSALGDAPADFAQLPLVEAL